MVLSPEVHIVLLDVCADAEALGLEAARAGGPH
jgi:hypothetical protein